jgi:GNAT superfamily N-acetyltransferase
MASILYTEYDDSQHRGDVLDLVKVLQDHEITIDDQLALPTETYCNCTLDEFIEECGKKEGRIIVAYLGNDVIGFVVLWQENEPSLYPQEYSWYSVEALVIRPSYRKIGVAGGLMKHAEEFACNKGVRQLRVNVLAANNLALSAYQRYGFKSFEVILRKDL